MDNDVLPSLFGESSLDGNLAPNEEHSPLAFEFPTMDKNKYYGIAAEVAKLATENSEADPMAVYISFLTASSALLGQNKYLQIGETKHYARLFVALVGASSRARKGTSFKPVERIIRKAEEVFNKRAKSPLSSLVFANGGVSSAEGLIYQVRDESEKKDKNGEPEWEAVDDKRLLVVEEEFANVLKVSQREGNTLSPLLRKAWDGADLAPMTKNNRLKASEPHINILAHITQYELKCMMSDSDIHNGLANRFIWASVRRTKKLAFPEQMNSDGVYQLAIKLSDALGKAQQQKQVSLDKKAREFWAIQYTYISEDKSGIIGSSTSRSEAQVMRLSLLFCLLDGLDIISQCHIQAAIALVEFCNFSVEFIFSTPMDAEKGSDADKLLNALRQRQMTQTEVSKLFSGHKSRSELSLLLTDLQSLNKIRQIKVEGSKKVIWALVV